MSAQMHMQVVLFLGLVIPSLTVRVSNLSEVTMSASGLVTSARPQPDTMTDFTIKFYALHSCGFTAGADTTITVQFVSAEWRSDEIQFHRMTTDYSKEEVISISVPFAGGKDQPRHINIYMSASQPGYFSNYHCGGQMHSATSLGLPPTSEYGVGMVFDPAEILTEEGSTQSDFPIACSIEGQRRAPEPEHQGLAPKAQPSQQLAVPKRSKATAPAKETAKPTTNAQKIAIHAKPAQPAKPEPAGPANHSNDECEICKSEFCNKLPQTKDVPQFSRVFDSVCESHPTCQQCGVTCEGWPLANIQVGCNTNSKNSFIRAMIDIWQAVKNAEIVEKKILELEQAAAQAIENKEGGCYSGIEAVSPKQIKAKLGYNPKEGVKKNKRIVNPGKWKAFQDSCKKRQPHGNGFKCVAVADKFRFTYPGQGTGLARNQCGDVKQWYHRQMTGKNTGTDCDNFWKQCMMPKKPTPDLELDPRICGNRGTYGEVHLAVCIAVKVEDAQD